MRKKFSYYPVNVIIPVCFRVSVLAESADDAISLAEDKLDPQYVFEDYSNDTCGLDIPWDTYDDDDETNKFELESICYWDSAEYEIDEYDKPEEVELDFTDEDEEEIEDEEE